MEVVYECVVTICIRRTLVVLVEVFIAIHYGIEF